jgi:DNA repair protein RadC
MPSEEDKTTTKRLQECGALMDIKLLDHIIVAGENGEMFSFRGAGMLDEQEKIRKDWER